MDADTRGVYTTPDVQQRSLASLELLLAAGGEINAADGRGQTPLHGAAFWGWNDVVQFLVDHHANLNAMDLKGKTPIDSAMGRAGGNSRGGQRIDVHEDTAALLKKLGETAETNRVQRKQLSTEPRPEACGYQLNAARGSATAGCIGHLVAQPVPADAQHSGCFRLIAAGALQRIGQQSFFVFVEGSSRMPRRFPWPVGFVRISRRGA